MAGSELGFLWGVQRERWIGAWRVPKVQGLENHSNAESWAPYSLSPLGEGRPGWGRVRLEKVLGLYSLLPSHPDLHAMCVSQQS